MRGDAVRTSGGFDFERVELLLIIRTIFRIIGKGRSLVVGFN